MKDDIGVAHLALQLQKHEIITRQANGSEIHGNLLAALRTTHLLLDTLDYLVKSVRVKLHGLQYITQSSFHQKMPGIVRFRAATAQEAIKTPAALPFLHPPLPHTMRPPGMSSTASLHGKTLFASLILILFGASVIWQTGKQEESSIFPVDITVEHRGSFGLDLRIGRGTPLSFLEIGNDGALPIQVAIPESWKRREVRNVPLAEVKADEPALGYVRWHLPAGAHVSFRTSVPWSSLVIRNPSKIPFKIQLSEVDMQTEKVERDVILIKDKPVVLP